MTVEYVVRPFAQEDLASLHEVREAAFKPVFQSFRDIVGEEIASVAMARAEHEQAEHLDKICEEDSSLEMLVIEKGGRSVGFCGVKLDAETKLGEIELIAVHPDHQNDGLGTALIEAALERMRKAGMRAATLGTGGDPSHAPARRAYVKAGFGPSIPSVWMFRML